MKKLLSVIMAVMMLSALTACAPKPPTTPVASSSEVATPEPGEQADTADELTALREENDELKKALAEASAKLLEQPTEEEQAILDDLNGKAPVLPAEVKVVGTLRFYPERTKLLHDKYVFAYAEDGHEISVNMILRYYENEDGTLEWESVLYDMGGGWEISE